MRILGFTSLLKFALFNANVTLYLPSRKQGEGFRICSFKPYKFQNMNTKKQVVKLTTAKHTLTGIICKPNNCWGQAIKDVRLRKNLTQKEAAELLKTSQVMLSAIETGKNKPSLDTIIEIAVAFKTHPFDILNIAFKYSNFLSRINLTQGSNRRKKSRHQDRLKLNV
jgi:transcriptional regulator with XRE-family HTH domain